MKGSQKFYENVYRTKNKNCSSKSFLTKLYLFFRKFETYREEVVFKLIPRREKLIDIGCGDGSLTIKSLEKISWCMESMLREIDFDSFKKKLKNFL